MYTIFDDIQQLAINLAQRISKPRAFTSEELAVLQPQGITALNGNGHGVEAEEILPPTRN